MGQYNTIVSHLALFVIAAASYFVPYEYDVIISLYLLFICGLSAFISRKTTSDWSSEGNIFAKLLFFPVVASVKLFHKMLTECSIVFFFVALVSHFVGYLFDDDTLVGTDESATFIIVTGFPLIVFYFFLNYGEEDEHRK